MFRIEFLPDMKQSGMEVRVRHITATPFTRLHGCSHLLAHLNKLIQSIYFLLKVLIKRDTLLHVEVWQLYYVCVVTLGRVP